MTPGPTPAPPEVLAAIAQPVIHHRGPDFRKLYSDCLGDCARSSGPSPRCCSSAAPAPARWSRRSRISARPASRCWSSRRATSASAGRRSRRHTAPSSTTSATNGARSRRPTTWRRACSEREATAVFFTHSETSTGVVTDLQPFAAAAREAGALSVVDAVSSLGAVPLETDAWGIDVVASGAQKALMTPPGLAMTSRLRGRMEQDHVRLVAPLLLGLGADAQGPGDARRARDAAGLARRGPRRGPADAPRRRAGGRLRPAHPARPLVPRGAEGDGPGALLARTTTARPSSPPPARPRASTRTSSCSCFETATGSRWLRAKAT